MRIPFHLIHLSFPLFALTLTLFLHSAHGHGMMCTPRQRGAYISEKCGYNLDIPDDPVIDYCAHCLNAGTVASVRGNLPPEGWKIYEPIKDFDGTAKRAGLCGDPVGTGAHMIGGDFMPPRYGTVPMVDHYKTGDYVDFVAEIDTNHNGYFEYFLCDLDSCGETDIHEKCFKQGHCYKLMRVPHEDCEDPNTDTHYECGPIDEKYPGRWYLPCRNTGHVGVHIVGGPSGTMRYKLPDGVSCKHCVIQWYWATANSCAPRGLLDFMKRKNNPFGTTCASDGGGQGTFRAGMTECGGTAVPEEFWSCADVQITKDGRSAGPVKAVGQPMAPKPPSQEEKLLQNPEKVKEKAEEELKKDIEEEVEGAEEEREKEEIAAEKGLCLLEGAKCDGSVRCCDWQQVCVFGALTSSFTCRFWWSLFEEAERMQKEMYHDIKEPPTTIPPTTTTTTKGDTTMTKTSPEPELEQVEEEETVVSSPMPEEVSNEDDKGEEQEEMMTSMEGKIKPEKSESSEMKRKNKYRKRREHCNWWCRRWKRRQWEYKKKLRKQQNKAAYM